jgi:hypothetical protein
MKNRNLSILLIALLSASFITAQEKISFAILGGANFQNLNGTDYSDNELDNNMMIGYHAGVNIAIQIAPEFYFQPGLMYAVKGAKNEVGAINSTTTLNYIEMPLNMVYKAMLGNGSIMLGFGPYLAYGISGKRKTEGGPITLTQDVKFQSTVDSSDPLLAPYYKPLDVGANILFGYEMASGIFLQLDAQYGMYNINTEYKGLSTDKSKTNNTGFGLSLGYRF